VTTQQPATTDVRSAGADIPLAALGQTWEQMTPGTVFRTAARTIMETDLVNFVSLAGFTEPLFRDVSYAAKAGYSGRLLPAALTFAIGEGLVLETNLLHGTALGFLSMDLSVKNPAYVGDTVDVVVEVESARAASRGNRGIVTTTNTIRSSSGLILVVYRPVRLIRGRDGS
jgi:acyl dehydratase